MKNINSSRKSLSMVLVLAILIGICCLAGCAVNQSGEQQPADNPVDTETIQQPADNVAAGKESQPNSETRTDMVYILTQYNLVRRELYLAGEKDKALNLKLSDLGLDLDPEIEVPYTAVFLFSEATGYFSQMTIMGIITPWNAYLGEDMKVCYDEPTDMVFFFDSRGELINWNGEIFYGRPDGFLKKPSIDVNIVWED